MAEENKAIFIGKLEETYYSDILKNQIVYNLSVERKSGVKDIIPIATHKKYTVGNKYRVIGKIKTISDYKQSTGKKIFTFIDDCVIDKDLTSESNNLVQLTGVSIKEPWYRTTPKGKIIVEMPILVGTDLIHCVAWREIAVNCKDIHKDDIVSVVGRLQSREYTKLGDLICVYEVSCKEIKKLND